MATTSNLEIEVKFYVEDLAAVRDKIVRAGGENTRPRVYEKNVRFDTVDHTLLKNQELLRLREDERVILTYKGVSALDLASEAKVREEIEVFVNDSSNMAAILERLGFQPVQIYEKYRETFRLHNVEIVLDEMPYGSFVELEGGEKEIKQTSASLGLNWEDRILSNYLAMMALLVDHHKLPFHDVTFANFQDSTLSIKDILPVQDQE